MRLHLMIACLFLCACPQGKRGATPPDVGAPEPPKFERPGKCFGKPSKCEIDANCGPPLSTCQKGACCSGTLDPATCKCTCDKVTCPEDQLCCPGGEWTEDDTRGKLMCRTKEECVGPF